MSEPGAVPGEAVMAVRQHLINNGCTIPVAVIREALEKVWPHPVPSMQVELLPGMQTFDLVMSEPGRYAIVSSEDGRLFRVRRIGD